MKILNSNVEITHGKVFISGVDAEGLMREMGYHSRRFRSARALETDWQA
jgi:hypothetical protein